MFDGKNIVSAVLVLWLVFTVAQSVPISSDDSARSPTFGRQKRTFFSWWWSNPTALEVIKPGPYYTVTIKRPKLNLSAIDLWHRKLASQAVQQLEIAQRRLDETLKSLKNLPCLLDDSDARLETSTKKPFATEEASNTKPITSTTPGIDMGIKVMGPATSSSSSKLDFETSTSTTTESDMGIEIAGPAILDNATNFDSFSSGATESDKGIEIIGPEPSKNPSTIDSESIIYPTFIKIDSKLQSNNNSITTVNAIDQNADVKITPGQSTDADSATENSAEKLQPEQVTSSSSDFDATTESQQKLMKETTPTNSASMANINAAKDFANDIPNAEVRTEQQVTTSATTNDVSLEDSSAQSDADESATSAPQENDLAEFVKHKYNKLKKSSMENHMIKRTSPIDDKFAYKSNEPYFVPIEY